MSAGGAIAGKVTGSTGQALAGICISVTGANTFGVATTTAAAPYTVNDLNSGKYTVSFSTGCGNTSNLLPQWYKNKSSSVTARSVKVQAAKTTPG